MGIGIGWPNASNQSSGPAIYTIYLYGCTIEDPTYTIYSLDFEVNVGSLYYTNPNLTGPFTGNGSPAAIGSDKIVFVNGQVTGATIPCA